MVLGLLSAVMKPPPFPSQQQAMLTSCIACLHVGLFPRLSGGTLSIQHLQQTCSILVHVVVDISSLMYCTVLYHTMLYHTMLYYTVFDCTAGHACDVGHRAPQRSRGLGSSHSHGSQGHLTTQDAAMDSPHCPATGIGGTTSLCVC